MEAPELDLQAGLDRLGRWKSRVIGALEERHDFVQEGEARNPALERDIQDFAIAAYREMGDVILRCREQLTLAWKASGAPNPGNRARKFEDDFLKPHHTLRAIRSARHADAHLGGLVVPRIRVRKATADGYELELWMSPKIPNAINELLHPKSQLKEVELMLFNSSDSLTVKLRDAVGRVERYVAAVYAEVDRINAEEGSVRIESAGEDS